MSRFSKTSDEIMVAISRPEGYEDVSPELVVEDSGIRSDFHWRVVAFPAPAAAKLPEDVQRDAARYRWLRDEPSSHLYVRLKEKMTTSGMSVCSGPTLDYEIDKRLADAVTHADEGKKG